MVHHFLLLNAACRELFRKWRFHEKHKKVRLVVALRKSALRLHRYVRGAVRGGPKPSTCTIQDELKTQKDKNPSFQTAATAVVLHTTPAGNISFPQRLTKTIGNLQREATTTDTTTPSSRSFVTCSATFSRTRALTSFKYPPRTLSMSCLICVHSIVFSARRPVPLRISKTQHQPPREKATFATALRRCPTPGGGGERRGVKRETAL